MSGHSKWHSIKHKKGAVDAKRGKAFTKLIKEITVSTRLGGKDPDSNPRLRVAIAAAKAENMPKENIERAIKKGTGELEGTNYEEVTYEGYGPGGVAVLLDVLTDNRNRAVADVRHVFERAGGNLGEAGCVSWMFEQKGLIVFKRDQVDEEKLYELALEGGAEDIREGEEEIEVITDVSSFEAVKAAFDGEKETVEDPDQAGRDAILAGLQSAHSEGVPAGGKVSPGEANPLLADAEKRAKGEV